MVADNHYPHKDELTVTQREKIKELRTRAQDILALYPEYDTDFSMLRWLMGWDYNIDVILPKMRHAVNTLIGLRLHKQKLMEREQVNEFIRSLSNATEFFPGGLMSQTDRGDVVYMQAVAKCHPKTLVKAGSVSELYRLSIAETEMAFKLVRRAEETTGRKLGVVIIMDLDGFSMDLLYTPTLKIYLNLLTLMQEIFPDFARRIFLINCPMMMSTVYAMISPVLSVQTREKVRFLDKEWKKFLAEEVGSAHLFPHWGGEKKASIPTGDVRMGGKVPEKIWYKADSHPLEAGKTKVNVGARSRQEIKMAGQKGKKFRWLWTSSGDIDFSIEKDGKTIYPVFRSITDYHPEIGSFDCEHDEEHVFVFSNAHGKIFTGDDVYVDLTAFLQVRDDSALVAAQLGLSAAGVVT
ncbi:unnamed protein product [Caenorhabditis auriculariae]|uniref:CRAL-TRIO domain-containing protein n=1 Tax=Caenorhabditis auriculariae TaxID=2777116 RepID=A0A8S1H571_9PELO|nr:unnamed protein product [Caenorhabditis auriculariae]